MGTPRLGDAQRLGNSGNVRTDKIQSAIIFVDPATSLDILFDVHVDDIVPIPTSHCTSQSGFGRRCVYYVRSALGKGDLLMFYVAPVTSEFYHKTHLLGSLEAQRRARPSSNAMAVKKARAREKKSGRRDANAANTANAGEAFTRLPNHLVVTHVLRPEYFDDPADLARLPAVSRAMRDAVAATGLAFEELDGLDATIIGCLSAVQRLQRQGRLLRQEYLCQAAARGGHLEELKVLRANGCPWNSLTFWHAAMGGHLEVIQWACTNGCPWDERTCWAAARGGHLEVLQWLRANGCEWDKDTCTEAATYGWLEVLQWAHTNGCEWDADTCCWAARGGYLVVLQWARENDCPWNERTCATAASGGHLEMLQWACGNGCPWDRRTCSSAARGGHVEVLRWARANGCPWSALTRAKTALIGYIESDGSSSDESDDDDETSE